MKQVKFLFSLLLFCASASLAQLKLPAVDKSPMDMAYYPVNYPVLKIQNKANEPLMARVIYSRPLKNGRSVFGELVEYGQIWRLGANEATEIEIYKDVKCGTETRLKKGRYTMYAIPYQDKWTIIFNKETDIWGAFQYDPKKDALRVDVPAQKLPESAEAFTMQFEKDSTGLNLAIMWDNVKALVPFSFQSN
ncbi:DUF2911 domain-containing protein [Paraflavitalea soli]|uniref:DUF2911 domain-containing protein n=1 Tax=Paraflavitalea soli TaxID=2315862 RepID=A0A3B7MVX4_9BACT|nr:DUF2911 domain-containing protein [Paraflavitalea soli]AXY78722.1 DUF2911 domain-containing protein [Paraflavitalea soli]